MYKNWNRTQIYKVNLL